MKEQLKKIQKNKKLCAIYTNVVTTTQFTVGFLLDMDEQYIILKLINPYGFYDGVVCIMYDDIYRVESETIYLNTLEKLSNYYNIFNENPERFYTISDVVSKIREQNRICEIELCDSSNSDIVGYINSETKNRIELLEISDVGENNGIVQVNKRMISKISFDSYDTNKLEILRELNK